MTKFQIGDKAYKPKGYKFPCTIVSVFENTKGETRIVAEMEEYGLLHIFNEGQLERESKEEKRVKWTNEPGNWDEVRALADKPYLIVSASSLIWDDSELDDFDLDIETPEGHTLVKLGEYVVKMSDGSLRVEK